MSLRSTIGNFLSEWAWRLVHGKVDALAQQKTEKSQKLLQEELARLEYMFKVSIEQIESQLNFRPGMTTGWQENVRAGDGYVGFEDAFRDSAVIAERSKRYLPYFSEVTQVLDIGCGRGEFLELLQKQGISVHGIDSSAEMIEACRKKGLKEVEVAQALAYLTSLPENSQGGIFSCHVLEHLPIQDVISFFPATYKALKAGGTLVVETPNPHSLPAFKLFWLDPTHVRPLFPEFLEWAARAGGFQKVEILYLTEDGFSATHGPWYGNYALAAHKGTSRTGASSTGKSADDQPAL